MIPYGLIIDTATSGFEALEKIKNGSFYDIIFMDHMMPKMDGIEATRLLREMKYTNPVVALTANALAGQAEVFLKSGFDGFVSKPIDIRHLNVTLNRLIRDKQPPEILEEARKKKAEMDKIYGADLKNQKPDSQLAEIFARDAEKAASVLESLLQGNFKTQSDIQLYVINVHAMKSALANIGQKELSNFASKLENAGRENDTNVIRSETGNFLEELRKMINEMKPKDDENQILEDSEDSLALLHEKLMLIKEACIDFDKKTIKNILNELKEKSWSQKSKELMNKSAECILHSEFENASSLADEYINNS
jgi:CheY-like chemotaxis protein/HPt (histidine-containing phosphotransfer) domain-containing protein